MRGWFNGMQRMREIILDPSVTILACRFGDIAVTVETEDHEKMERLCLGIVGVRVSNLLILSRPEAQSQCEEMRVCNPYPWERIPVPEREVEVFYLGGDDPSNHGIRLRYKTIRVWDILFEVIFEETGYGEFMRCLFFGP
ncbi:MAG: hypothetical protein WHS86_12015 [Desulfosoma sp.]